MSRRSRPNAGQAHNSTMTNMRPPFAKVYNQSSNRLSRNRRRGFSLRSLLVALAALAGVGVVVWFTFPSLSFSSQDTGPMMYTVAEGDFVHDITERGNVESASNVEIRCEVESRGSQGTMILELIDEGAYVEPGDILCKLDSSSLEQELVQQQIVCNTSEAAVIQAKNNYETAVIAKDEYILGTYAEALQGIEGDIFVAEENLRRAKQTLAYTEKLFARGYVTSLAVEADEFSVRDAETKLAQESTRKEVLEKYTKEKNVKQLDADIKTTEAKLKSEEHSYGLDKEKLADLEAQVEKCTVVAPDYGQVVYANVTDRRGGSEIIIEEGGSVRERQVIFRLPDPNRMQVKAKINEASVSMVESGMRAGIRLDAFPDLELKGEVEKVNEYPVPTSFFSGNVKEYETTIRIHMPNGEEGAARNRKKNGKSLKLQADSPKPGEEAQAPVPKETVEAPPKPADGKPAKPETDANIDPETETKKPADPPEPSADTPPADDKEEEVKPKAAEPGEKPVASDSEDKVQLRPGMTAEVKIRVQTIPNVLQVPVQAIVEHGGKNYVLTYDKAAGWAKHEVKIGATNDKTVVIREGLQEGDKVVMGAAKHRDKLKWPKIETIPGQPGGDQVGGREGRPGANGRPGGERSGGGTGGGRPNGAPRAGAAGGGFDPAQAFGQLDKNSDGKLSEDEVPGPLKSQFAAADKNGDGGLDVGELTAAMRAGGGGRAPGQGGGPPGGGAGRGAGGAGAPGGQPGARGPGGARPGGPQ